MTPTQEVPLPDMPEVPTLWAVHIQGPDDVIATDDRADAEMHANAINEWFARWSARPEADPLVDPRVRAEVVEWEGDPEGHAADLARGAVRWAA